MEISWNGRVPNEVLRRIKEESNILYVIKRSKAGWVVISCSGTDF